MLRSVILEEMSKHYWAREKQIFPDKCARIEMSVKFYVWLRVYDVKDSVLAHVM